MCDRFQIKRREAGRAVSSEINIDEEMAAYAIDNRTMVIATVGECSMAYAKAQLKTWFSDPTIETIK